MSTGGALAALFPGQGSQAVGMGRAFFEESPAARDVLERAEQALPGLLRLMFEGPEEELRRTALQQPALVAAGAAAYAAWREAGGSEPSFAAGHSLGEFTAHVVSGSLAVGEAVRLVHARGRFMQEAVPEGTGAMAAILKVEPAAVEAACAAADGVVEVANLNAPGQTVISGAAEAVAAAAEALKAQGARAVPLPVSAPFHCSLMRPAAERLAPELAATRFGPAAFPVVANVNAQPLEDPSEAPALLEAQVTAPVRWVACMERLHRLGARRFVELGSGKVLTGLAGRILTDVDARAVSDPASLREALAASEREGGQGGGDVRDAEP